MRRRAFVAIPHFSCSRLTNGARADLFSLRLREGVCNIKKVTNIPYPPLCSPATTLLPFPFGRVRVTFFPPYSCRVYCPDLVYFLCCGFKFINIYAYITRNNSFLFIVVCMCAQYVRGLFCSANE